MDGFSGWHLMIVVRMAATGYPLARLAQRTGHSPATVTDAK